MKHTGSSSRLTPQSGRINYEQLAAVLLRSDADLPPELTAALLLIRDLSTPESMDKLQETAVEYRVDLGLGADAEPAEVAARFWLFASWKRGSRTRANSGSRSSTGDLR